MACSPRHPLRRHANADTFIFTLDYQMFSASVSLVALFGVTHLSPSVRRPHPPTLSGVLPGRLPPTRHTWRPGLVVTQMLAEQLSELQHASELQVSVEMVSPSAKDRTPAMNSVWQQINHQWIIPPLSALTRFRRRLTRPLMTLRSKAERELWLKHPANMDFEQHLHHWITMGPRTTHESGVVASGLQGKSSAFLRSTKASAQVVATLRQTIKADDYRGKQLRFSGDIKVEQVEQQAGLYIRTNRRDERLRPENVVQGTHDWMRYEATVPVAEDAPFIRFGLVLHGKGQIWLANAQLEVIEQG